LGKFTNRKEVTMGSRNLIAALFAFLALALPASAAAAPSSGAVVFSRVTQQTETKTVEGPAPKAGETPKTETKTVVEGGLYAVKDGRLNQLTEDPTDTEPAFSPDGTSIAFVRGGHLFSVRADGSGLRQLTSGSTLDSKPVVSPDGRLVVFERRTAAGAPADLYTVRAHGGGLHALTSGDADDHDADFSADGHAIAFVRTSGANDDVFSVRPSGARLARLSRTGGVDEFEPRYFAGGILFSRGDSSDTPAAYADVYTMRANGSKVRPQVRGVGSAYVEDVSANGHTLLFRRDQGLWVKRIGPSRARKLCELPDGSETNGVFSSDGRRVAAFVAADERERLVSIDVANGRQRDLAEGVDLTEGDGTTIGPVISWQPVR
jgi:dipeptidyl aminopeptidase/acylaminoacyl peptidase